MALKATEARELIGGRAEGSLLHADVGLSFWGGVDPILGTVIDHTHPLHTQCMTGKVLAIPNGRGSCTGSQVMLELLLNDIPPAALLLRQPDVILCLGVFIAEELFGKSIPVLSLGTEGFDAIADADYVYVEGSTVHYTTGGEAKIAPAQVQGATADELLDASGLVLTADEEAMMSGAEGEAKRVAMRILSRAAAVYNAPHLLEISQAHIDGCTYIGPGGLRFAESLVELGGKVAVPTTLNSISVDRNRWRSLGVSPDLGEPAYALGDAYLNLGATRSFTCAPYLLDSAPSQGDQIAWGESNAVTFANSILGARTQKYADYLDICAAITARVPAAGPHLDAERVPTVVVDVQDIVEAVAAEVGDAFYPALGYLVGNAAGARVPLVTGLLEGLEGLEGSLSPTMDDLKALSAAFGTSGAAPMFHIAGVTPEATPPPPLDTIPDTVVATMEDFATAWTSLDSAGGGADAEAENIDLVALGNPHLSLNECADIAALIDAEDTKSHPDVSVVATMGRQVFAKAKEAGHVETMEGFGFQFVNDTCWCMLTEPVVPVASKTLITNSGKYAHYAPGLVNRKVRFGSMAGCIAAARTGRAPAAPAFLSARGMATLSRFARILF